MSRAPISSWHMTKPTDRTLHELSGTDAAALLFRREYAAGQFFPRAPESPAMPSTAASEAGAAILALRTSASRGAIWAMLHLLFILSSAFLLTSCATTPYYYKTQSLGPKLSCFDDSSVPSYELDPTRDQGGYSSAVLKVNQIFATSHLAIVSQLFEDCGAAKQPAGPAESDESDVIRGHVSAFTEPFALSASPAAGGAAPAAQPTASSSPAAAATPGAAASTPAAPSGGSSTASTGGDPYANFDAQLSQQVTLIISSYLYTVEPADRLSQVFTLILPLHEGVKFQSVPGSRIVNLLSVGSMTTQNQLQLTLSTPSTAPVNAQAQPTFSRQLQEAIAKQYTTQNVEIFALRNILFISQNAGPGAADISGNSMTSVTMQFPPDLCSTVDVWSPKSAPPAPAQPKHHHHHQPAPQVPKLDPDAFEAKPSCYIGSVYGLVASVAVARAVDKDCGPRTLGEVLSRIPSYLWLTRPTLCGADTIPEDDDVVELKPFKSAQVIELWRNPNRLYGVALKPSGDEKSSNFVTVDDTKFRGPLLFGSASDALGFMTWLQGRLRDSASQNKLMNGNLGWAKNMGVTLGLSNAAVANPGDLSLYVYSERQ